MRESTILLPSNKPLPVSAPIARKLERWAGLPLNILEAIGSVLIVMPFMWFLRRLDTVSFWLEGTRLRTVLQHAIFPLTITVSFFIAFEMASRGATFESIAVIAAVFGFKGLYAAILERLMPFSRNWLEGDNDMSVDIMMLVSGAFWNGFAKYLMAALFVVNLVEFLEPYGHGLWPSQLPGVVQVLLFILIKDFFRYWLHRAMHENAFLWRFHATHHSVKRLYWLNGIRSHPVEVVGQAFFYVLPFALLQPSAEIIMVSIFMQLSIGIFQHSNIDLKLGFWEYIFSIGDNHRYHHYPNKDVGDSNYGGEFIVWDILFGTFHKVKGERPHDRIGIGTAPNYPMTMAGLLIAPFLPDQKVFGQESEPAVGEAVAPSPDPSLAGLTEP
ncbi:MAG: sterol desaturase family protein [Erythrobacter sp.]|nr:sterol desaturase family protein [Erythrobacter sp.]